MPAPTVITYRDMEPSPGLESKVAAWASNLEEVYDRIIRIEVVIGANRKRGLKGARYDVGIRIELPGPDVFISNHPGPDEAHEDAYLAVRDSFKAARRRLQDHVATQLRRDHRLRDKPSFF